MANKLKNFILIFILSLSSSTTFASFMIQFNSGVALVDHSENHYVLPAKDVAISEYLLSSQLGFKLPLISRVLNLSANIEYLYPKLSPKSATQDITYLNYNSRLTFIIPSKPFTITAAAEYFSDTATASDTTFGYAAASGIKYSTSANFLLPMYALNINLYYPFTIPVEGHQQYKATITYYFGMRGEDTKGTLLKAGTTFQVDYEYKKFHDATVADPVDIRVRIITASLGFIW